MTGQRYMTPCGFWIDGHGYCGVTPTRHYLPGHRCQQHTPAAIAGKPEPGQTAYGAAHTPTGDQQRKGAA